MFTRISASFKKFISSISSKLSGIFSRTSIDENTLHELEKILLEADVGAKTARALISHISEQRPETGTRMKELLQEQLQKLLHPLNYDYQKPIILLVGINGSGKTTCASKLVYRAQQAGKKVLLVAADTFRAAAQEQLAIWAERMHTTCITGTPGQDPASVVWKGCEAFRDGDYDLMIIDTAGRLQTKSHLMQELSKIKRTITKVLPERAISTLLTIDSMLGQNSLDQARLFHESTELDGIILTKTDGTGKGGIVFAIAQELTIPIAYVSSGEQPDALEAFNAQEFIHKLLG